MKTSLAILYFKMIVIIIIKEKKQKKACSIQLSPAKPFSNSRSLFLIFAIWHLRGVLDPRKHNSAPLSITNNTLVLIHDIFAA